MRAVVLAGGPPDAVSALQPGAPNKAFVEINGKTLVERTAVALREAQQIDRITIVAPTSKHDFLEQTLAPDDLRPDGIKISESLRNGLANLPLDELVLI